MTVKDLAAALGVNITTAFRDLKRRGYDLDKRRMLGSGQWVSVVSREDAERYKAERAADGFAFSVVEEVTAPDDLEHQVAEVLARMRREFEAGVSEITALIKSDA